MRFISQAVPRILKRALLGCSLIAAIVALASTVVSAQQPPASPAEVVFGTIGPSATEWPFYIADQMGYFREEGLKITVVTGGSPTNVALALATGGTNIASDGTDAFIAAAGRGLPIRIIATYFRPMAFSLVTQPTISTWAELTGQSIALGPKQGGLAIIALRRILEKQHLHEDQFTLAGGGSSSLRYAALQSGNVQAAFLGQPWDLIAQAAGYHVLASAPDFFREEWSFSALAVQSAWGNANKPTVAKVLRALKRGVNYGYEHRERAISILVAATHTNKAIAESAYDANFGKLKSWDRNLGTNTTGIQNVAREMLKAGDITALPNIGELVDATFGRAALGH